MKIRTTLTKRRAKYAGEVGFFADDEMAEEDIRPAKMDEQVMVEYSRPKTLKEERYLWGLVYKVWLNTDFWSDHRKAMEALKVEVGYTKAVRNIKTGKREHVARSTADISAEELHLLTERIKDVIYRDVMPGMPHNDLHRAIEEMLGERPR